MTCYSLNGLIPVVHPSAYVHPSAVLIGDVIIGPNCYVGPLASLRGDFGRIVLEEGANIQDTCVMHGFPDSDTVVGCNGHIGHGAVLHGCRIGEDVLVGINAVVMDGAEIGARSFVSATAFVKAGFSCAEQSLVMGTSASVKRPLSDQEVAWKQVGTRPALPAGHGCLPAAGRGRGATPAHSRPGLATERPDVMNRGAVAPVRQVYSASFSLPGTPITSLAPLNRLITRFQEQTPIRASSLIITIYGDAIEPHGGTVWLSSLIQLLEPMGINERLIRTSIFRLTKEGWLSAEKVGRRSYYSLTGTGRRRFEKAFKRVYSSSLPAWDGSWCLALLSQLPQDKRKQVREELEWQGFGAISPVVLACPRCERVDVAATLQDLDALEDAILFDTYAQDVLASKALRMQVRESWKIDELASHYSEFIQLFRPLWQVLREKDSLQPVDCFLARILLIHEYRKLLLRDPQLPDELLPGDWEGRAARQLCRNIYRLIHAEAEQWLNDTLETADGPLPDVGESFYQRFGGLG